MAARTPTYRCLFPNPPEGDLPTCESAGILGALTGMVGAMMALEVVREIVGGFGDGEEGLVGKLLLIDAAALPLRDHPLCLRRG